MTIRSILVAIACTVALSEVTPCHGQQSYNPSTTKQAINLNQLTTLSDSQHKLTLGDAQLNFNGYLDSSIIDRDIAALGHTTVLTSAPPSSNSTSAYGAGTISIEGGLLTGITFAYGNRGDQHFNEVFGVMGGFTGLARSKALGYQAYDDGVAPPGNSNTVSGTVTPPNGVVQQTTGGLYRQFSVGAGQPAGPVTVSPQFSWGGAVVSNAFESFRWTNGTSFGNPNSAPTRPGKAQIAGIEVDYISFEDILTGSVKHDEDPHTMFLEFAPRINGKSLPLAQLAASMGVHHFNWLQQVTAVPTNTTTAIVTPKSSGGYELAGVEPANVLGSQQQLINSLNITKQPGTSQILQKQMEGFIDVIPQIGTKPLSYGWVREDIPLNYTVQSGDTLSQIAERFDVSTSYLARFNNIANPDAIQAGVVLRIKDSENYWPQRNVDAAPLYWNEVPPEQRPFYSTENLTKVETEQKAFFDSTYKHNEEPLPETLELATKLKFEDQPVNPFLDQSDPENSSFSFRTELVGVAADGSLRFLADEFPNSKLAWEWKSNTEIDPDRLQSKFLGGVFNVGAGAFPGSVDLSTDVIAGGIFGVKSVGAQSIAGDFDASGAVDGNDFLVWQRNASVGSLSEWRANFGSFNALVAGVPIPEPLAWIQAGMAVCLSGLTHLRYRRT